MQKKVLNTNILKPKSTAPALKIAAIYFFIGVLWILLSDSLLYRLAGDRSLLNQISLYKGWFFISVTALIIFFLIKSQISHSQKLTGIVNENEHKYKLLFENNPVPMWVFDKESFKFLEVNDAAVKSYGYSKEEFLNMGVLDIRPEEDREKAASNIQQINSPYTPGEPWRHKKKDETIIRVEITGHDINYMGKNARIVLANDITQKWTARQELKESERRFREVLSNLNLIAVLIDNSGSLYFCNNYFLSLTGYSRDEVIGKNYFDIFFPAEEGDELKNTYEKAVSDGSIFLAREHEIVSKTGQRILVTWHNTLLRDSGGAITGTSGIGEDITEKRKTELDVKRAEMALKESEERYRLLVELSTDAIFIRSEGKFVYVNKAGLDLFGAESLDQIRDKEITEIIHKDYRAKVYMESMHLKEVDILAPQGYEKFIRLDGSEVDVEVNRIPFQYNGKFAIQVVARDITERKKAEQLLKRREHEFKALIEHAPDIISRYDRNLKLVYINPAIEKVTGTPPSELINTSPEEKGNKDNVPGGLMEILNNIFITGRETTTGFNISTRTGTKYFYARLVPEYGNSGEVEHVLSIARDITDLKEAELNLKRSEKRFRALIENSKDAITVIDSTGAYKYISPSALRLLGYSNPEMEMMHFTSLVHNDDLATAAEKFRTVLGTPGGSIQWTLRLRKPDKSFIWAEGFSTNLINDPAVNGIVSNFRDITEKKDFEESLLQKTIDLNERNKELKCLYSISSLITKPDVDVESLLGQIVKLIPSAMQHPEIAHSRIVFNKKEYSSPGYKPTEWCYAANIDIEDRSEGFVEVCYSEYDIKISERTFVEEEKALINAIATHVKETIERRNAIEEIKQLNTELEKRVAERTSQLEAANKELESFSYSVSHDLRAPLRAIDGFSKILIDEYKGSLDDEAIRLLNIICSNTEKMSQLIDDLLSFSRLSQQNLEKVRVDMKELVSEVTSELEVLHPGKKPDIRLEEISPAYGDPNMLKQVLINLLNNAIKFTSLKENGQIKIGSKNSNGDNIYYISDNGVGFNMKYADKLFGVFQRLHSNKEFEGTGVGLALCKKIVNRHGGKIWAEGKINEGATFYFTL